MPKQSAFRGSRGAMKKVRRHVQFPMGKRGVVLWSRLLALIAPHYPNVGPKDGCPPIPLETMLRVYVLQNWYALSHPMAEETLYDSEPMGHFAGMDLIDDRIPDESTILNFRNLLERNGLIEAVIAELNEDLADKGITFRSAALVHTKNIDASSSTKNMASTRNTEMSFTRKGNKWYFGMKAPNGVDMDRGTTHSLDTSTAKLQDSHVWDELLHRDLTSIWADKGHVSARQDGAFTGPGRFRDIMRKASKGTLRHPHDKRAKSIISMVRVKVEHPFRIIKRQLCDVKTRYCRLAKTGPQLFTLSHLFVV